MSTSHHDLVRRLFDEVFNQRDFGALADIVAERFVEHAISPFGTEAPGLVDGPAHMRGVIEWLVSQYPDLRMTVETIVAEDDAIAVRVSSEGTNLGLLNGIIPATGKRFSAVQAHWYRVDDSHKLAEHWAVRDDLRSMMQLGVISVGA